MARRLDPAEVALQLAEHAIDSATEGLAPAAIREIARGLREQPRRGLRARIRAGRLERRLARVRARDPSVLRRMRARLIEAKIDRADAVIEALEAMESK